MKSNSRIKYLTFGFFVFTLGSCKIKDLPSRSEIKSLPISYLNSQDTINTGHIHWSKYFSDPNLVALIDTALSKNQELNIMSEEINIAQNEVWAKKGEYMPFVGLQAGIGPDRASKYTWDGQSEEDLKANPEKAPKYIGDFGVRGVFSWELDIWKKLRNSKKAAALRYLASIEGKNFMKTQLISEIANSYYELLALDNQMDIIKQNIVIQENALRIVNLQKEAAKVTQLAINRFEAQLLNTKNLQYDILQQIVETENKIYFLTGKIQKSVIRNPSSFNTEVFDSISVGVPGQLLVNRPDIMAAEGQLAAAKLDVMAARANFMPNVTLSANLGLQAFNPVALFRPVSILYSVFGDLMAPLINKNAIEAQYRSSGSKQMQAVYNYEQTILKAYLEVMNQLSGIDNYTQSLETKAREVDILIQSVVISGNLFNSARADYMEVLLTQREALESKMELVEVKKKQLSSEINIYKALGGGWN